MRFRHFVFSILLATSACTPAYALSHKEAQELTECNAHGDGVPYPDGHVEYQKGYEYCAADVPALWDMVAKEAAKKSPLPPAVPTDE